MFVMKMQYRILLLILLINIDTIYMNLSGSFTQRKISRRENQSTHTMH